MALTPAALLRGAAAFFARLRPQLFLPHFVIGPAHSWLVLPFAGALKIPLVEPKARALVVALQFLVVLCALLLLYACALPRGVSGRVRRRAERQKALAQARAQGLSSSSSDRGAQGSGGNGDGDGDGGDGKDD